MQDNGNNVAKLPLSCIASNFIAPNNEFCASSYTQPTEEQVDTAIVRLTVEHVKTNRSEGRALELKKGGGLQTSSDVSRLWLVGTVPGVPEASQQSVDKPPSWLLGWIQRAWSSCGVTAAVAHLFVLIMRIFYYNYK